MGSNMKPDLSGATASVNELTALFAVNRRTIASLASKGILVKTGHGRYERAASIRAYVIHLREQAAGRLGREDGSDVVSASADLKKRANRIGPSSAPNLRK